MTIQQTESEFLEYVKQNQAYGEALSVLFWDLRTGAPKKGVDQRSETIGVLSSELFRRTTSNEMGSFLEKLSSEDELSERSKLVLAECKKEYDLNRKIPQKDYERYVVLQSKAESVWEEAKEKQDYGMFQPYLAELVQYNKQFIELWGVKDGNPYNTLLDQYEPGMTVNKLDELFTEVRNSIVPLVEEIAGASKQPNSDLVRFHFPKENQKAYSLSVLKELGYDFSKGRLDETVHPFAIGINRGDVRITTKYDESDFRTALFGTIHECGHAIYEQNISIDLEGTPLADGTSMGIHESQSLFYENFIGRNPLFWKTHYPSLQQAAGGALDSVGLDDFYFAVNESKPSLIRIEADELTYPLHIMIRYEIEKQLITGNLDTKDLPEVWNSLYEEYLGVRPPHDGVGVLQDVHWSGGSFGYFPSYALGLFYASQLHNAMEQALPFDELVEKGEFLPIREWLTTNVHQFGKTKKPLDVIQDATGEALSAKYFIQHMSNKYRTLYNL